VTDGPLPETTPPADAGAAATIDRAGIAAALAEAGPAWVAGRRWFGSKARRIASVTLDEVGLVPAGDDTYALVLATLGYADGGTTDQYFLPVVATRSPGAESVVVATMPGGVTLVDAPEEAAFRAWFLESLAGGDAVSAERGMFRFEPTDVLGGELGRARGGESRVIRSEQSNSSLTYGDAIIAKLFRRLQPGVNPDLEIGRFLTERTAFRAAPPLVGGLSYLDDAGGETSIALLQVFVPSSGDAWTATLAELADLVARGEAAGSVAPEDVDAGPAELLGRRTGQLHVALASSDADEAFHPETVTPEDIAGWERETIASVERQRTMLDDALPRLSPPQQRMVVAVDLTPHRLAERIGGYRALEGTVRIRVHGDYHLGQVLRSLAGDVVLLDFEGEPLRTIAERRQKTASLKDVAGMLRSLRYARAAAVKGYAGDRPVAEVDRWLALWEAESRGAFLAAYREEVAASPHALAPDDDADFAAALAAWELDKAVYELAYEANNRPDWLDVPLMTLAM
jgi:maltose alpha-D-glucosyltransferase / alpha-amylase